MAKRDWKDWTKKACTRAVKTVAQAALAQLTIASTLGDVNWKVLASTAILAGLISLATSVYGLPEEKENEEG
ncbi:MAG: hypothetical protein HXL86_04780 [[Eubacterium] sulci]|jgi:hypothetical protein|nr:hypothetical protein [[Eubacterium] sulci]DAX85156.1 MAG TPA: holin [Caudoviricetes sp.]